MPVADWEITPAHPSDAVSISQLIGGLARYFTLDPQGKGAEAFLESISPSAIVGLIAAPNMAYFKAVKCGQLAGVIAMRENTHLYHLFVGADFQRQGLSRSLWEHARAEALSHGGPEHFTVNSTPQAVPVYERFGFVVTGPRVELKGIAFVPMRCLTAEAPKT